MQKFILLMLFSISLFSVTVWDGDFYNVTFSTFTLIAIRTVETLGPIMAWCAGTLVNVNLTHFPRETCGQNTQIQYHDNEHYLT